MGSQACLDAASTLRRDFETFCDEVHTEDFTAHPLAFLGFIKVLVLTYSIGVVFLWLNLPVFAWFAVFCGVTTLVLEYLCYFHFVDFLYPAALGRNVWGVVEPQEAATRVLILSGHHDSAQRFNFYEDGKPYQSREKRDMGIFFLFFFVLSVLAANSVRTHTAFAVGFPSRVNLTIAVVFSAAFFVVREMWFFLNDEGCPGAGDNLVSTMMFAEVARYFRRNRLRRTKVVLISFDGEECGLRGARSFWDRHRPEFDPRRTFHLNSDCPYYEDELKFLTRDVNLWIKLDEGMANKCVRIANGMGLEAVACPIAFFAGGTDSGEAARAGIRTTCLLSLPFTNEKRKTVYHTIDDTIDQIEPSAIAHAIAIAMTLAREIDDGTYGG
jgi:hypothetical protein